MNSFSANNRTNFIRQLDQSQFDLVVIGGGITGAGIALDAAARGLKVVLLDMQDFAAGTSSRSTKLIHGGLRYLKQFEIKLVAEVGKERAIIHRNAPHLTKPEPMLLPITKNGSFGKFTTRLGMVVYERLAGVKKEERHQMLSTDETLRIEPSLLKDDVLGGVLFYEYRTDDARLTISVMKEAVSRGAMAINYMKVTRFLYQDGKINGLEATDQLGGGSYQFKAGYVINAAGPWVDELDSLDNKAHDNKLQITKGVHIVVDHQKLPVKQSVYFDTYDKRMMFVIPRQGKTYIGTTDTFYTGDKLNPLATAEDRAYLLKCANDYFPQHALTPGDIESGWAGLRPLIRKPGKKPSEISRKDETFVSESGLITIAGGKLTGYRKMAQRVLDIVAKKMRQDQQRIIPKCITDHIVLPGGKIGEAQFHEFIKNKFPKGIALGLSSHECETLIYRYGSKIDELYEIMAQLKEKEKDHELPLSLRAQLLYTIGHEMCVTPGDFFIRRTGMLYFDIGPVKTYKAALTGYMQDLLHWDELLTAVFKKQLEEALLQV